MVIKMAQTVENCSKIRMELTSLIISNNDLQVIKTFNNEFQVQAYMALLKEQNKKYMIERTSKVILKLGGLISAVSGAIAVLLEVLL